jgi:hypothetical protein
MLLDENTLCTNALMSLRTGMESVRASIIPMQPQKLQVDSNHNMFQVLACQNLLAKILHAELYTAIRQKK